MSDAKFSHTEVLSIETTHDAKAALLDMARDFGLPSAEHMAAHLVDLGIHNYKFRRGREPMVPGRAGFDTL
jgi:hypothetical protein